MYDLVDPLNLTDFFLNIPVYNNGFKLLDGAAVTETVTILELAFLVSFITLAVRVISYFWTV